MKNGLMKIFRSRKQQQLLSALIGELRGIKKDFEEGRKVRREERKEPEKRIKEQEERARAQDEKISRLLGELGCNKSAPKTFMGPACTCSVSNYLA